VGTAAAAPYSLALTNVALGAHTYTARATDNLGTITTSTAINVIVNALPSASISAPSSGTVFIAPATIAITATAADSDGTVAKVDFYQGTRLLGTSTTAPYSFTWSGVAGGSYNLTAVATDDRGGTSTSAAVSITVNVNAAPTVSITSPGSGGTFTAPANITLTADAADSDGSVASVAFYYGTTLITTRTAAPYTFTWAGVPRGSYALTAVVTDDRGASITSAPVSITVNQAVAQGYYIHVDHLNTPRLIADSSGTTVWRNDNIEPFGDSVPDENPSELGPFEFPLRLGGWQYADKETGHFWNWMRTYAAMLGRFDQFDPIGLRGGINGYVYVTNTPLRFVDPMGLVKWTGTVLGGSAGSVGVEYYTLMSECKCNKRVYVDVRAEYFSFGVGVPFSYTGQSVDFEDGASCPIASMFDGSAGKASAGVAAGVGWNCSVTTLGRVNSSGCGPQMGYEGGMSLSLFGRSQVTHSSEEKCCQ
jgi:RHS repeat-associated protein